MIVAFEKSSSPFASRYSGLASHSLSTPFRFLAQSGKAYTLSTLRKGSSAHVYAKRAAAH